MRRIRVAVVTVVGLLVSVPAGTFAAVGASSGTYYRCDDLKVLSDVLARHRPATDLAYPSRAALGAEPAKGGTARVSLGKLAAWQVIDDSERRVAVIRPDIDLEAPSTGGMWLDLAVAERTGPVGTDGRPAWRTRQDTCVMYREFDAGNAFPATVHGDPTHPAGPTDTVVHLLVREANCNNGDAADGRVSVVEEEYDTDAVGVILGVFPVRDVSGNLVPALCPGNPLTPYTMTLAEPLGGRPLVDARFYPPVVLRPYDGVSYP